MALSPEQLRAEASCATQWSAVVSWASLLASLSLSFLCSEVVAPTQAMRKGCSPEWQTEVGSLFEVMFAWDTVQGTARHGGADVAGVR